jgi:uncharacterized membrane protein
MIAAYLATLASFLLLDFFWLKFVMRPIFEQDVPHLLAESPRLGVAAGFYALYCVGIVFFAVRPGLAENSFVTTALYGAALGFLAYGCYEATNLSTLRGWTFRMLAIDVTWGAILTAVAACAGLYAARL